MISPSPMNVTILSVSALAHWQADQKLKLDAQLQMPEVFPNAPAAGAKNQGPTGQ